MVPRAFRLLGLCLAVLPFSVTLAAADDGPSRLLSATGPVRPEQTILRVVGSGRRETVLIAGGYAADPTDTAYFAPLVSRFPDYQIVYFGNGNGPYDTRGGLDENAAALNAVVRRLVREEDVSKVHAIGHSNGGAVLARSAEIGLGARDNLASLIAVASPTRGASAAAAARWTLTAAGDARPEVAWLMRQFPGPADPDDAAVRDLATRRRPVAPQGVRTLVLCGATDELVARSDCGIRGAERVDLLVSPVQLHPRVGPHGLELRPEVGAAHGLILHDERAQDAIEAAIRGNLGEGAHPIVRWWEALLTDVVSTHVEPIRFAALTALGFALLLLGRALHTLRWAVR